jgi:DNA-binding CsgD family transcriptional regulator
MPFRAKKHPDGLGDCHRDGAIGSNELESSFYYSIIVQDVPECNALNRAFWVIVARQELKKARSMILRLVSIDASLRNAPGYLIAGDAYQIGRLSKCHFIVNDPSVSRIHAEVTANEESVLIKDLRSTNGTYVDGDRIDQAEVWPGQAIRFGRVLFHVTCDGAPISAAEDNSTLSTKEVVNHTTSELPALRQLSEAQRRVLDLLLRGQSEKEVAIQLNISPHTVHNHVKAIYQKMAVNSRSELLALFVSEPKK